MKFLNLERQIGFSLTLLVGFFYVKSSNYFYLVLLVLTLLLTLIFYRAFTPIGVLMNECSFLLSKIFTRIIYTIFFALIIYTTYIYRKLSKKISFHEYPCWNSSVTRLDKDFFRRQF